MMMKTMKQLSLMMAALFCLSITGIQSSSAQYVTPALLDSASLESQLNYIQERTRIYNDFRAIREDIFLKIKKNAVDSLNAARLEIATLNSRLSERDFQIETLNTDLGRAKTERDESIRNRDSLTFLGIQLNKAFYNTIMWFIVIGLATLGVILFLLYKRTRIITIQAKKEFELMEEEFEAHKKAPVRNMKSW